MNQYLGWAGGKLKYWRKKNNNAKVGFKVGHECGSGSGWLFSSRRLCKIMEVKW